MKVFDYYRNVFVPANSAVSAMRVAGTPINLERVRKTREIWLKKMRDLERQITSDAGKRGINLEFSDKHSPQKKAELEYLYGSKGLGLEIVERTKKSGAPSAEAEALMRYASIAHPRADDIEEVWALLKQRSYAKGVGVWLNGLESKWVCPDGNIRPTVNWSIVKTSRVSMENPPMQQIPERSDIEIADGVKSCFVPRMKPARTPEEWDPRRHGSCFRWDISGAEAAIRAAMLVKLFNPKPGILWDYIRQGKDVHSLTASLCYGVPEGTYTKGSIERDQVGKQVFFSKLFGGSWRTVQRTVLIKARIWLSDAEAQARSDLFDKGYPELVLLYHSDIDKWSRRGYVQDGYGRRRVLPVPPWAKYKGYGNSWDVGTKVDELGKKRWSLLSRQWHMVANTPTQAMNATDNLWMIAMCHSGERIPLQVPAIWGHHGVLFSEAKNWLFHEGPGPGGKPFLAWHTNTVHDSGWGDCGPGYLEPTAKVLMRRCTAVPFNWRLKSDVPYRVELKVGPDQANLKPYNKVAHDFGLEPIPEYCQ